ncbi:MAG TPA: glycosyltransferase, partial [Anaerolineae bacterium]
MRICLDLSPVVHRQAGLATYARNIAEHLLQIDRANSYSAFFFAQEETRLPPPLDELPYRNIPWGARRWRLTVALDHILKRNMARAFEGVDLFHATEHLLPPLPCRSVFTFHDAIYALFPQYHLPLNYWYLKIMMPRFLKRADAIIAVSECSKRDAMRLYNVAQDKIRVIYEGVNPAYHPIADRAELERVRTKYHLPDRLLL